MRFRKILNITNAQRATACKLVQQKPTRCDLPWDVEIRNLSLKYTRDHSNIVNKNHRIINDDPEIDRVFQTLSAFFRFPRCYMRHRSYPWGYYHVLVITKSYSCPACLSTELKLHRITCSLICDQKVAVVTWCAGVWNPKAALCWFCCCRFLKYIKKRVCSKTI